MIYQEIIFHLDRLLRVMCLLLDRSMEDHNGGTAIGLIIKKCLVSIALNVISNERFTVVKLSNWLLIDVSNQQ